MDQNKALPEWFLKCLSVAQEQSFSRFDLKGGKNVELYFSTKLNFVKFEDSPLLLDCELLILWG